LFEIEEKIRNFYLPKLDISKRKENQARRVARSTASIKPYIIGNNITDFGCGLLGEAIGQNLGKNVRLVDNLDFNKTKLPLTICDQHGKILIG